MKVMKNDPDMLKEYDFSKGIRGKYAKRYTEGTNLVLIDPDVAEFFPDHESINEALRSLINIIKKKTKKICRTDRWTLTGVSLVLNTCRSSAIRHP